MKRTIGSVLLAVVLLASLGGVAFGPVAGQAGGNETTANCTYPIEVTDANGATVTIEEEPERVVTLAPSASQVMWEIGAQEKVVGMPVNPYTSYLDGSAQKQNVVGQEGQPQTETIIGLEPDLVLAPNIVSEDAVAQLRNAGLTVYRFDQAASISDVVEKTRLTGRLVGEYDTAREISARTEATLRAYRNATSGAERPTVLYAMGGGYTAGPQTFIGDVIDAAGGENVAAAANISEYGIISNEIVVQQDPDWIVVPEGRSVPSGPDINGTTAIQEEQVLFVDNNFISQPGPRVTQPLEPMAEAFHPDGTAAISVDPASVSTPTCEADVTPTATATATATETLDMDGTVTLKSNQTMGTTTDTTTTSGPGFGVIASIVALLGAGTAARRR
ncbi:PGF-CTERM sorting domain-containing protein [Halorhabdus sp. CBA1104]|uniref:PGF-CTERM-anchored ABC transporter substrate-binding protein n=1 Tax=Halorhabdus sp. CBA1104 TaxID=1380432 RepID=UPI0012B1E621|nr:PGF-CTERM-anchored ABC transporter substrate-binding protein [Halorhabdus sp. CBA1104]QGN07291.1 PGF-CTERM sorting domain-containing protein [Halorhabdus sp. CBA1104]